MKLENTFSIPVPFADAWPILLDLERIAPCVPGATLLSREGDEFHGRVKVKLGPVGLSYNGTVKITSRDRESGVAVLEAGGREARGNGTAKATVTCRLKDHGDRTDVFVETDLAITGKPAQFGRGALAEVSSALLDRFATNLAAEIGGSASTAAPPGAAATPESMQQNPGDEAVLGRSVKPGDESDLLRGNAEPINLLDAAKARRPMLLGSAAAAGLLLTLLLIRRRRRHR